MSKSSAFADATKTNLIDAYEAFRRVYPDGTFREQVDDAIARLQLGEAKQQGTVAAYVSAATPRWAWSSIASARINIMSCSP